jgi:hypothetical protein
LFLALTKTKKRAKQMKTTLQSPSISEMTKLGFNLINFTSNENQIRTHEIEKNKAPWDSWFYCPVNIGNKRFFECWHKAN